MGPASPGLTLGAPHADAVHEGQVDVRHLAHQAGRLEKRLRREQRKGGVTKLGGHHEAAQGTRIDALADRGLTRAMSRWLGSRTLSTTCSSLLLLFGSVEKYSASSSAPAAPQTLSTPS